MEIKIKSFLNLIINYEFIKKLFKQRRSDVSLFVYARFIFLLFLNKLINQIKGLKPKDNSCLILFPPSLGLGDLIILSKIVNIVKNSKRYKIVGIGYSAPFLQKIESDIELIDLKNIRKLISYKDYLLPSPSILNSIISLILGRNRCYGYLNNKNFTNIRTSKKYYIKSKEPYFYRLKPFKEFFGYKGDIKPHVWSEEEREELKLNKSFLSINTFSESDKNFLIISTYNFYSKFRPSFKTIKKQISKLEKGKEINKILILGSNSKKELIYNRSLEKYLLRNFVNLKILNYSGSFNINNSLELISQSTNYIGANNGLANVAQMLGIKCTLIFNGPESSKVRRFSKFANFIV